MKRLQAILHPALGLALLVAVILGSVLYAGLYPSTEWETCLQCPCGELYPLSYRYEYLITHRYEPIKPFCCPQCGVLQDQWKIRVVRLVNGQREIKDQ